MIAVQSLRQSDAPDINLFGFYSFESEDPVFVFAMLVPPALTMCVTVVTTSAVAGQL